MVSGADLTPSLSIMNGGSTPDAEDLEAPEGPRSTRAVRPPRSVIRHCASAARLDIAAESVCSVLLITSFNCFI